MSGAGLFNTLTGLLSVPLLLLLERELPDMLLANSRACCLSFCLSEAAKDRCDWPGGPPGPAKMLPLRLSDRLLPL